MNALSIPGHTEHSKQASGGRDRPGSQLRIPHMRGKPQKAFAASRPKESPAWTIYKGDSKAVLARLDDESIDCMVSSPPYYWQRDYEAGDQEIGQEPSIAGYVGAITDVMTE